MRNWIIVALILLVIGLIGNFQLYKDGNWPSFGLEKVEQQQQMLEITGINHIEVETGSANLQIVSTTSSEIKAALTGSASKKYKGKLHMKLVREGDTAKLSYVDEFGFSLGFNIIQVGIKLELPEKQWKSFTMHSSSGNTEISQLSADTIELAGKSGNMHLNHMKTLSLTSTLSSGNMDVSSIIAGTTNLATSSGNMAIHDLKGDTATASVRSGNIKVVDVDAQLKLTATSGNIRGEFTDLDKPMEIKTGSGDVKLLSTNEPNSVLITFKASSGDLKNKWKDGKHSTLDNHEQNLSFGDSSTLIKVNVGSGNLSVGPR